MPDWPTEPTAPPAPPSLLGRRRGKILLGVGVGLLAAAGILALVLTRGDSKAPPPAAAPSPKLLAPTSLAFHRDVLVVTLSWTEPSTGAGVQSFDVYRNGHFLVNVVAPVTSYKDTGALPGKSYRYEVQARAGTLTSPRAAVQVHVPKPGLADARLDGTYNVKAVVQAQSGYSSLPSATTFGFRFTPKCKSGPCDAAWRILSTNDLRSVVHRVKAAYEGSVTGQLNVRCGSSTVISTATVSFHVTQARAIYGKWVATKLVGTVKQTEASQLGCVSSYATYAITSTRFS
jgi:hypothetical protein